MLLQILPKSRVLFSSLFLLLLVQMLQAQSQGTTDVKWVGQFPSKDNEKTHKSLGKKLSEFITGKQEDAVLVRPIAVIAENPDTFFVLDQVNGTLFEVNKQKLEIPRTLRKKFTSFTSLVGLCYTSKKEILFTDSRLNHIYMVSPERKNLSMLNDTLLLQQPTGIACSPKTNDIWVVETAAHRVRILDVKGMTKKIIGKRGTDAGEFNFPTFISIDSSGIAYVVDAMNFRIQLFDEKGEFISEFGEAGDANGYFARPKGIATDSYGHIYIVDALFHTVQIFDNKGNFLYKFGQQGQDKGDFWMPTGIYIDKNNYIYIADSYNARVQIFQLIFKQ